MNQHENIPEDATFVERRRNNDRRRQPDNRSFEERRHDFRYGSNRRRKSLHGWLRSIIKARMGVDRRKRERRQIADRRQQSLKSLLTREEIEELLKE